DVGPPHEYAIRPSRFRSPRSLCPSYVRPNIAIGWRCVGRVPAPNRPEFERLQLAPPRPGVGIHQKPWMEVAALAGSLGNTPTTSDLDWEEVAVTPVTHPPF